MTPANPTNLPRTWREHCPKHGHSLHLRALSGSGCADCAYEALGLDRRAKARRHPEPADAPQPAPAPLLPEPAEELIVDLRMAEGSLRWDPETGEWRYRTPTEGRREERTRALAGRLAHYRGRQADAMGGRAA